MSKQEKNNEKTSSKKFLRIDPGQRLKVWKKARYAAIALILLVLLVIVFGGQSGFIALLRYSRYEKTLQRRLAEEQRISDSLEVVLTRLRSDPEYKERAAREKLRMIEEGEIIVRFEDSQSSEK